MPTFYNISLKNYNTFGIDAKAKTLIEVTSEQELMQHLKALQGQSKFILGGGSNMLLQRDIEETVLHIHLKGKEIIKEENQQVLVRGMAGENWHEFVLWTLQHDLGGLENLSLIPGNVGTTPVQNIGAYGVEIKDRMVSCDAIHKETLEKVTFSNHDCAFGYRESIFKHAVKDQYIITSVTFLLDKAPHTLHTSYGAISQELEVMGIPQPSIQDVSKAVIRIRESKLPNPKELGNSGSFFKNPIVDKSIAENLLKTYPEMPHYTVNEHQTKVPAGWLIEQAGFKGKRIGNAGMHAKQALVLVNYGEATGAELWEVAQMVQNEVLSKFGIALEPEVNVIS
ncbi:MAG: UDP-N-acetylmuramate dehydrogenase [Flavobacteriales bacterium]|nr:UDP-N-acetylmuramate dehydrogenase [Flavobacteriales bacterium]